MLIGRQTELARCLSLLDDCPDQSGSIEFVGDPGIGKTALTTAVIDAARSRGFATLTSRPTMAEAGLDGTVLGDLLGGLDHVDELPDHVQRHLRVILGAESADEPPTIRELGMTTIEALSRVSTHRPVLIVIDDAQWMDQTSRNVLGFALRRLPTSRVCAVIARRSESEPVLDHRSDELGPLGTNALAAIVTAASATPLQTSTIDRVAETAGGNPLFALELTRGLGATGVPSPGPMPVPSSLNDLVAQRVQQMPPSTIEALALAALMARPTVERLSALVAIDALRPAEHANIVEIVDRNVRFTHPLLASAAHDAMSGSERLELHRRLATISDGLERWIHLGRGTERADALVAAQLTDAIATVVGRGATAEAADLASLALSVTPVDDPLRDERALLCADTLFRAGRTQQALDELDRIRTTSGDVSVVVRALLASATIEYSHSDSSAEAVQLAERALSLTDDRSLRIEAHTTLARVLYTDFAAAADHAEAALDLIDGTDDPDPRVLAGALTASATASFMAGRGLDRSMFDRAIALEHGSNVPTADSARGTLAALLKYADQIDEARSILVDLIDVADEGSLPYVIGHLPQLELWSGRWAEAERYARLQLDLSQAAEQDSQVQAALFNIAMMGAYRGDIEAAAATASRLIEDGRSSGSPWSERNGTGVLGFIAHGCGDPVEAIRQLRRYDEIGEAIGLREPGYVRFHADLLEAYVAVGDIDAASELIERLAPRAERLGRPSAQATVLRGRALILAHTGDPSAAVSAARQAVEIYERTGLRYERARTLLTLGIVARRAKQRGVARQAFDEASVEFAAMGARLWEERADVELARVGGRTASSRTDLTPTERRVAEMAAGGRSNKEISAELFMSTKTVEANLTRVFQKLGVTNRASLAAGWSARSTDT